MRSGAFRSRASGVPPARVELTLILGERLAGGLEYFGFAAGVMQGLWKEQADAFADRTPRRCAG